MSEPVTCKRCFQLIELRAGEWVTAEWPKGLRRCPTISHPSHAPVEELNQMIEPGESATMMHEPEDPECGCGTCMYEQGYRTAEAKVAEYDEHHMEENYAKMQVAALQAKVAEQAATIERLTKELFNARQKATEVVDTIVMYRHKYSERTYLEGAARVRNEVSAIIDAALSQQEPK